LTDSADTKTSTKRQKTMAVLAAGLVLGLGATVTLAVWNDSEFVTGGVDNTGDGIPDIPGVGTSVFEVQQNVSSPYVDGAFANRETNPGGALTFTAGALALTPGDVVYAPVSLTTTGTSVAATSLALAGSVPATGIATTDPDDLLYDTLGLRVVVRTSADAAIPADCDEDAFLAGATFVVGTATVPADLDTAGATTAAAAPGLSAAGGNKLDYCFEIAMPEGAPSTLQGRTVAPAWQFIATSVE
jgi:predicted ribosomally synthesized peptide with SipW-like signal peptide